MSVLCGKTAEIFKNSLAVYYGKHQLGDAPGVCINSIGWDNYHMIHIPQLSKSQPKHYHDDLCTKHLTSAGQHVSYLQEWMLVDFQADDSISEMAGDSFCLNAHGTNLVSSAHTLRQGGKVSSNIIDSQRQAQLVKAKNAWINGYRTSSSVEQCLQYSRVSWLPLVDLNGKELVDAVSGRSEIMVQTFFIAAYKLGSAYRR